MKCEDCNEVEVVGRPCCERCRQERKEWAAICNDRKVKVRVGEFRDGGRYYRDEEGKMQIRIKPKVVKKVNGKKVFVGYYGPPLLKGGK